MGICLRIQYSEMLFNYVPMFIVSAGPKKITRVTVLLPSASVMMTISSTCPECYKCQKVRSFNLQILFFPIKKLARADWAMAVLERRCGIELHARDSQLTHRTVRDRSPCNAQCAIQCQLTRKFVFMCMGKPSLRAFLRKLPTVANPFGNFDNAGP